MNRVSCLGPGTLPFIPQREQPAQSGNSVAPAGGMRMNAWVPAIIRSHRRTSPWQRMIGSSVGHYRIEAQLGSGGMGVVYRAYDTTLRRRVAIKFLSGVPDDGGRARVLKEARAASALNHPNICTIHEVAEADG